MAQILGRLPDWARCKDEIKTFLSAGKGSVKVTLSSSTAKANTCRPQGPSGKYSLDGRKLKQTPSNGVYIENGKKIVKR